MGPKKGRRGGGGGGGGDKQGQPPPAQQQVQQPAQASQPRQLQGAAGGQGQGPQQGRAPQPDPQPRQQQQQPQAGRGQQQRQGQPAQQPAPAWGKQQQQQPPQQQQEPQQAQARGGQQRQGPQQASQQPQAGRGQQQRQGPQQTSQQPPQQPAPAWGKQQQQQPPQQQQAQRQVPSGFAQRPPSSQVPPPAAAAVPAQPPPQPAWQKPPSAPVSAPITEKVAKLEIEAPSKQPDQSGGKGGKKGGRKDQEKGQPAAQKPTTAPEPGQASASSQQGAGAPKPERKIGDGKDISPKPEDMLVISPRRTINQKDKPGRRIRVETNHLAISFKKQNVIAYHYDVTFEPDKPKYLMRPAWNEFAARFFKGRHPSFDGKKNVYSNGPLPGLGEGEMEETIQVFNRENERNKEFKIKIKYASRIDLSEVFSYVGASDERGTRIPRDAMQAIDIVLRNLPANQLVQSGRLFFSPPEGRIYDLGEGLDMWYGFHQSAILGWKPYLNVDIAHKGFPTPCNLLDTLRIVCEWNGNGPLDRWQVEAFRKYIKRLKVEYLIPNLPSSKRVYRVNDIVGDARSLRFTLDNGQETTVEAYYERERNYKLRYPYLPCLWVGSATGARKIYIATELCKIVEGQVVQGKMSENQTAKMVKEAAKGTDIRKERIMSQIRKAKYDSSPYANEFGISVAGQFEQVEARVLPAPQLHYQNKKVENPRAGVWRVSSFEKPAQLTDWCIICLDQRTRDDPLNELERMLQRSARQLNMNPTNAIQPPRKIDPRDLERVFTDLAAKKVKIVFVVVPDKGDGYSRVKKLSELRVGILTQCIKAFTVFKKLNPATIDNILLKVNAKLNGVNHILAPQCLPVCLKRPAMVVGADVTHPSPDSTDIPSVAAVAASHCPNAFQYNMIVRLQDPRDEMIRDFQNIMRLQLLYFYKRTGYKPEKILFFRDGVSDGQIPQVFNIEFQAMRRACQSLQPEYNPPITFVIVQKRHHTRFFPMDTRDCDDKRNWNVPAGTCVDTQIVHPRETDFYLVSHASIQGTARPTKYRLVWDDNNLGEVELQNLTYYLCHLFSRCTRSVSYPAPTYNAHLAAFRGRVYLEGERVNLRSLDREQRDIHQNIRTQSPMHFV